MLDKFLNKQEISKKIQVDTLWNLISFAIIGLSGISFPILIAKYYSPTVLGSLNISLIILTICSQISGFGVHFSVLKYISEYSNYKFVVNTILISSILLVTVTSLVFCLVFLTVINYVNAIFPEKNMELSLYLITPALYFLALNKILLGYYNGLRKMKLYAIFNSVRYLNWIIILIIFIANGISSDYLPIIFLISEFLVFLLNLPAILLISSQLQIDNIWKWIKLHFVFGFKAMHGAVVVEFNSKVDVLALSILTNSFLTGIYTIASMILDGFLQLIIVFRTIINPLLTKYYLECSKDDFLKHLKKGKYYFYAVGIPLILLTLLIFPVTIDLINLKSEYKDAYLPLIISLLGLMISFGYQPFQLIFNQTGFPIYQTLFFVIIFLVSVGLNFALIPYFSIYGCALATSISSIMVPVVINLLSKKSIGFAF